jgi:hypothetical protein
MPRSARRCGLKSMTMVYPWAPLDSRQKHIRNRWRLAGPRAFCHTLGIQPTDFSETDDDPPGTWIAPRLHGDFGAVTLQVPHGYSAYVRICHPATTVSGLPATWSEVARATGRNAHPLMQWDALVGSDTLRSTGSLWNGRRPERGNLAPGPLAALCARLSNHTAVACRCFLGVWEGWHWLNDLAAPAESRSRLTLPGRDYLLLAGSLQMATQVGYTKPGGFEPRSPNLLWPEDHSWFVASEVDFDSTLVGGTADLIDALVLSDELDAWPVGPDDSLASDADTINRVLT